MYIFSILDFLHDYDLRPNKELYDEYAQSKVTKKLNTLPTRAYINSKFDEDHKMSEEDYEWLRKKLESRPPFVFYFNPDNESREFVSDGHMLFIGFFDENMNVSVNKRYQKYSNYYKFVLILLRYIKLNHYFYLHLKVNKLNYNLLTFYYLLTF